MKKYDFFQNRGFTLVEMLLAIAILVVLSSAILVSISSQKEKAERTRTLSEVSATIQPIYMCLADGGDVSGPSSGSNICTINGTQQPAYGQWPSPLTGFSGYTTSGSFSSNTWTFGTEQTSSNIYVCCQASLMGCEIGGSTCP